MVTAGTRSVSINDCHGQGPVDRERLEVQLGCAFLMMAACDTAAAVAGARVCAFVAG